MANTTTQEKKNNQFSLIDLPIGSKAKIAKVFNFSGCKKFADIGFICGSELIMESHAPLGSLIRVKIMGSSMAISKSDAKNIIMTSIA